MDDIHKIMAELDLRNSHYNAIGRIATNWAALEAIVTSAIWQVAEVPDRLGACITSQIFTFDGKMKALIALLSVRGELDAVIKKLNKFHNETKGLSAYRNRLLHDPAYFDPETGMPKRLESDS